VASGLVFGTPGMTRRVPKEVLAKASMGHSAGLRDGSGKVSGHAAFSEGLRKEASARLEEGLRKGFPRGGCGLAVEGGGLRRRVAPKGFSKAVSKRVFREGASKRLRRGLPEGCFGLAFERASRRLPRAGGAGRWI